MRELILRVQLKSDATFGRGDGVVGLVDAEVEHDPETGLPFIRGRVLKGLLVESCANVLYALGRQEAPAYDLFRKQAPFLFGRPGSLEGDEGALHVGRALLPADLRRAVEDDLEQNRYQTEDALDALTAIRRQTAVDDATGAPEPASLRSVRVVVREVTFTASLRFAELPGDDALALLDACVRAVHRGGLGRNRGRGRFQARLCHPMLADPQHYFRHFAFMIRRGQTA